MNISLKCLGNSVSNEVRERPLRARGADAREHRAALLVLAARVRAGRGLQARHATSCSHVRNKLYFQ